MPGSTHSRRLSVIAVGCLAAATLAACGSNGDDASTGSDDVSLAFFAVDATNTYSQATLDGIREVAKSSNASVTVFDGKFDVPTQLSQIESAIASGKYDGFIIHPVDGNALVKTVEDAIEADIAVGTTNGPIGPEWDTTAAQVDGLAASVFTPAPEVGRNLAKLSAEACADADPCQVAYLMGSPKYGLDANQKLGFDEEIAKHPAVKVVAVLEGEYSADQAYTATQNALQANPDLDVLVSNSDGMVQGAAKAVEQADASVALIGNGGSQIAYLGIEDGTWYGSTVLLPTSEGRLVAEGVIKAATGGGVSDGRDAVQDSPIGPSLTAKNAAQFTPEWDG